MGENGTGKSTLLEAIAVAEGFNPEGGTKNYHFSTYNSHSELHEAIRMYRSFSKPKFGYFLRAESFYNFSSPNIIYFIQKKMSLQYRCNAMTFIYFTLKVSIKELRVHYVK